MRTCRPTRRRASTGSRFNPRAREGRDDSRVTSISFLTKFQSTRPRGARRATDVMKEIVEPFQSTRPRGARQMRLCPCAGARPCFNPRAHEGRDLAIRTSPSCVRTFQSTRPRGARRPRIAAGRGQISVSIHAPTRGATSSGRRHERPSGVSIHAPARGATSDVCRSIDGGMFQSTRPRGARRRRRVRRAAFPGFNPRAHEGRDDVARGMQGDEERFQSTRPRGARHALLRMGVAG